MAVYTEKIEKKEALLLPLKAQVAFPSVPMSLEISDRSTVKELERIEKNGRNLFLVMQKDASLETPSFRKDFHRVGTLAAVREYLKLPDGGLRLLTENRCRAILQHVHRDGNRLIAEVLCKKLTPADDGGEKGNLLRREVLRVFDSFRAYLPKVSDDLLLALKTIRSPGMLADFLACNMLMTPEDKIRILEEFDPLARLELLAVIMEQEIKLMEAESEIHRKVMSSIEANQREYYLKEQLKAIRDELGESEPDNEIDEYAEHIEKSRAPDEIKEKMFGELKKLSKMPYASAESGVERNYLDFCLDFPWGKRTTERTDIDRARKILERDHNGLEKVKTRVIEYLATRKLNPELGNQILCLVGPPGTGKTSICRSLAEAMNRKMVRVSLGGIRDEADIRGHRKTYVGAMPGRVLTAIEQAGVVNPLILFDEVDKMTADAHGDPASALLEVLDAEQNKSFRDHFMEAAVDLSECIFITTANTLDTVPRPLIDRMEVVEVKMYTRHEKLAIAKDHLIPKQRKRHGLKANQLKITDGAILEIIDYYTAESGVRNLEREIASLCRKTAVMIVDGTCVKNRIDAKDVSSYLGTRKILPEKLSDSDQIGIVNGLAYTETGGDLLKIEALAVPGTGKIELTGSLGDVMKESAETAVSCIRARAESAGIDVDFYKNRDVHLHFPDGATPKDGPSAGIGIATALYSELTGIPVRRDVAMTGEITLRGKVLPIGGLREKTMAAYRTGIQTVILPKDNERDLEEIDPVVKSALRLVLCETLDEVLSESLVSIPRPAEFPKKTKKTRSSPSLPVYDPEKPPFEEPFDGKANARGHARNKRG